MIKKLLLIFLGLLLLGSCYNKSEHTRLIERYHQVESRMEQYKNQSDSLEILSETEEGWDSFGLLLESYTILTETGKLEEELRQIKDSLILSGCPEKVLRKEGILQ